MRAPAFLTALWLAVCSLLAAPPPPGVVIAHSLAITERYIGSPSLVVLPNGDYLAAHDFFGPGSGEYRRGITRVYGSHDRGQTWELRSEVHGSFWPVLFVHHGILYLLGVDHNPGNPLPSDWMKRLREWKLAGENQNNIVIRLSEDGGHTWTRPQDDKTGLLRIGRSGFAPTPVIEHAGRVWRAASGVGMMSAPVEADLLNAASWRFAEVPELRNRRQFLGGAFEGWGEGNAVVAPDGHVVNLAKVRYSVPGDDRAALITFDDQGKAGTFDPVQDFVKMPGARIKFTVRYDPISKRYWALTNYLPPRYYGPRPDLRRNTAALVSSPDLRHWQVEKMILENPDTLYHGFQYLDWVIEGNDLIAVCRTAWPDGLGGPNRQHDANYLTFHRIPNFREAKGPVD